MKFSINSLSWITLIVYACVVIQDLHLLPLSGDLAKTSAFEDIYPLSPWTSPFVFFVLTLALSIKEDRSIKSSKGLTALFFLIFLIITFINHFIYIEIQKQFFGLGF